jgi:hypothetical protein
LRVLYEILNILVVSCKGFSKLGNVQEELPSLIYVESSFSTTKSRKEEEEFRSGKGLVCGI